MKGDIRFKEAVRLAKIKDGDKILDLGSASNVLLDYIDKEISYTSVDYSLTQKDYVSGNEVYQKINCNLEKDFPKELEKKKFDKIFLLEILEHIENFKTLLLNCKKILAKNGRIIITIPHNSRYVRKEDPNHFHCFNKKNLINLANWLGLKYKIQGVHVRIPKLNIFFPSKQTVYNDTLLMVCWEAKKVAL